MAVVPRPARRALRDRPRLVAVALLALVSMAAAGINATAAERLQALLDENWRGTYDILVTADGNHSQLGGLLAPNSLTSGTDALTLDDLATITAVPGIEIAAPIGEVVVPGLSGGEATITLPRGAAGANDEPQAFRVTMTYRTDDGLGERFVSEQVFNVVVDETVRELPEMVHTGGCNWNGFDVDETYPILFGICNGDQRFAALVSSGTGTEWSSSDEVDGDTIVFRLGSAPLPSTRITLVDPVAERALLGAAGDFLLPLVELDPQGGVPLEPLVEWAQSDDSQYASDFLTQEEERQAAAAGGFAAGQFDEFKRLYAANGADFEEFIAATISVYAPLLVRDVGVAPLSLQLDLERFGATQQNVAQSYGYLLPAELTAGEPGVRIGTTEADVTSLLNGFVSSPVAVAWPGTQPVELSDATSFRSSGLYYRGTVQPSQFELLNGDSKVAQVRQSSAGFRNPVPDFSSFLAFDDDGTIAGVESAYSTADGLPELEGGPIAVPVGSFSTEPVAEIQTDLSYVPLGAYETVGSTLVPGSSPTAREAMTMQPSVSGFGLVGPRTVAIASINSASTWGQDAPISAVRIRVAGIDTYSAAAQEKLIDVTQAIEKLGYSATIVSGSSPTDVTVWVDDYAFGVTDAGQTQEVGTLGAVTQRWSELGAASRVDLAVSITSMAVLAVAVGASALLLAAVQLASVPGRRAQASVMRTIGWRRRRIVRWMAAEEVVSLALVALAGAVALALASSRSTVAIIVAASIAALVVTSALAVGLGARPTATGIRPVRRGKRRHRQADVRAWVVSQPRFAARQLAVHRLNAVVQLLATVVVAVSAAAITVTVVEGRAAAGASALGEFATNQALLAQLALGLVALIAGVVLAVIARRIDLGRRREQWATMRGMGWSAGQVRVVQLMEGAIIGIPSIGVACALAWLYTNAVAPELGDGTLMVAGAAALLLTITLVLTSWREKR